MKAGGDFVARGRSDLGHEKSKGCAIICFVETFLHMARKNPVSLALCCYYSITQGDAVMCIVDFCGKTIHDWRS